MSKVEVLDLTFAVKFFFFIKALPYCLFSRNLYFTPKILRFFGSHRISVNVTDLIIGVCRTLGQVFNQKNFNKTVGLE